MRYFAMWERRTLPPGFDLAAYARQAEEKDTPTVVMPSALLLSLLADEETFELEPEDGSTSDA